MGATPTRLHQLRERLAAEFEEILNTKDYERDKEGAIVFVDGKPLVKRQSPAMLNVIRQYLKDNGIDREALDASYDRPSVVSTLPFVEDEIPGHLLGDSKE